MIEAMQRPDAIRALHDFIAEEMFPCAGAKAALNRGHIDYVLAHDLGSDHDDPMVVHSLQRFSARAPTDALFLSLAVLFPTTQPLSEVAFERALWQRLQAIHDIDARNYDWDASVSSDVKSPYFSMSVGGKAYYVVGLHPGASRPSRRFEIPALIFNLHSQFEALRRDGRYAMLREAIRARDMVCCGSLNPMLSEHGVISAARQYSGRPVDEAWECPFRKNREA